MGSRNGSTGAMENPPHNPVHVWTGDTTMRNGKNDMGILSRPRKTLFSLVIMAILTGSGAFGLAFRRSIKTSPIKLGFRMAGNSMTKIRSGRGLPFRM